MLVLSMCMLTPRACQGREAPALGRPEAVLHPGLGDRLERWGLMLVS